MLTGSIYAKFEGMNLMLSYLTTGSILFSLYAYYSGKKLKKQFQLELKDIVTKNYSKVMEIASGDAQDFFDFITENAGIIVGSSSPQYLKKCLLSSFSLTLAWVLPLIFGVLNYFFGNTSHKLYSSIIAVIVAVINYKSGLFSYFATQDKEQNLTRAIMNYRSNFPEDEIVQMLTDDDPILGRFQASQAIRKMEHWLDRITAIAQIDKLGL